MKVGRPTTTRTLYQGLSDSEAKPSPIGEGTKARQRLDLMVKQKYVKVTESLIRLQRERRRYGVTSAVDID
jgi:hypothetical protein